MAFKRSQKIAQETIRTEQDVNPLPAYEQIIAEKLEGIEIPDMADAIWVRIETALDVEMPANDSPADPQGKPFFKRPAVWMISAGIIAIIVVLLILSRTKRATPFRQKELPQHSAPNLNPDTTMKQGLKPTDRSKQIPEKNAGGIDGKQLVDTPAHSTLINVQTDSLSNKPPGIKMPPADVIKSPSTETKQPKKYGVEVSDSDYRFKITPKKGG